MNITNETEKKFPENSAPHTDKYFLRAQYILQQIGLNPVVSIKVFSHNEGKVSGLEKAVEMISHFSKLKNAEIWIAADGPFRPKEPLVIIKGPVQSLITLETLSLGIISNELSTASGIQMPDSVKFRNQMKKLRKIYREKQIIYFGARHYHWSHDKVFGAAAIEGGADQTSTDTGSLSIGKEGVGTIPHALILLVASRFGRDIATVKTAELFDSYIADTVPRITLIDTFNREISDSLMVADYYGDRQHSLRIDTCGENIGEYCSLYNNKKDKDPTWQYGTGVTIELVKKIRSAIIKNGYGATTDLFLTSGFGTVDKAKAFMQADCDYCERTGFNLFSGVGIGEVIPGIFATADIFEISGRPFAKTGREFKNVDYSSMKRIV